MKVLYNPWWNKKDKIYFLLSETMKGIIEKDKNQKFTWKIVNLNDNSLVLSSKEPNPSLWHSKYEVEKNMGYKFTIEEDYEMEKGCKCGSCTEKTGKWNLSDKEDIINLQFNSEEEAIKWIEENYNAQN